MSGPLEQSAVVRSAETTEELAVVANAAAERGAESLRVAGEALAKARALCPTGRWGAWLKVNWRYSHQYATKLIRLARGVRGDAETAVESLAEPVAEKETCDESSDNGFGNSSFKSGRQNDGVSPSGASDTAKKPQNHTGPSPTTEKRSPWVPRSGGGGGDPSKVTDEKRAEWAKQYVPQPEPPVPAGVRLRGPELTAFVGELAGLAERLRDGLVALRAHYGAGSPEWLDVCVLLERLLNAQKDCARREAGRG